MDKLYSVTYHTTVVRQTVDKGGLLVDVPDEAVDKIVETVGDPVLQGRGEYRLRGMKLQGCLERRKYGILAIVIGTLNE